MKKHDYLKLKISDIEQYSMVIKTSDLEQWKKLGWLTFTEIGLSKGDEEAFLLYGRVRKNEMLIFNRPTLLKDIPKGKIIGHKVLEITTCLGTYGMGGAGYFGLLLDNSEFLTYAVWNAGNYVIINERIVECSPELYDKVKPWISNYGDGKTWDDLTAYIVDAVIIDYSYKVDNFILTLNKNNEEIQIDFVKNDVRLPAKSGQKRSAYKKGDISDYLLFQHKDARLIV